MGRLAVVAGGTETPKILIETLKKKGVDFVVMPIEGSAEPEVMALGQPVRIGAAVKGMKCLKKQGVDEIVLIGSVRRPSLWGMMPDWSTLLAAMRLGITSLGDDGLLRGLIKYLEKKGFKVSGIDKYMPYLLAPVGEYGKYGYSKYRADIRKGLQIAKVLGDLDVGQGCVVQQGLVLGVEGIEGTDALIARCGELKRCGQPPVLVKVKKPQQDRRVDLPTIGEQTVKTAAGSGFAGIAVEAGSCLIVRYEATVELANKLGLFIVGLENNENI
jgi:DUF1009 family protein